MPENPIENFVFTLMDMEENFVLSVISASPIPLPEEPVKTLFEIRRSFVKNLFEALPPFPFGSETFKMGATKKGVETTKSGLADKHWTGVKGEIY